MEKKKTIDLNFIKKYSMFIALVAIFVIFNIMTGGTNATPMNMNNLIMQNSYVVILATGMLLCVLTGNVDLGVGSYLALCGSIAAKLVVEQGWGLAPAFAVTILIGIAFGAWNGFFIAYLDIPPFVVTLAGQLIGRGLTYTLLQSKTVGPLPDNYVYVGAGHLPNIDMGGLDAISLVVAAVATVLLILAEAKNIKTQKKYGFETAGKAQTAIKLVAIIGIIWFFFFKLAQYNGVPVVMVIMVVIVGIYHFITSKTVAGRQIYALGGNAKAARLSGIDTRKVFFWVYTNMGFLSALAGIVLSARNASATPKAGDALELDAIASCYIGGAAAAGGVGTIIGAVIGAFVMGILNNGMFLVGLSTDLQKVVKGLVLLGAVTFDILSNRKKK